MSQKSLNFEDQEISNQQQFHQEIANKQKIFDCSNIFTNLNKTLKSLNNDAITKYETYNQTNQKLNKIPKENKVEDKLQITKINKSLFDFQTINIKFTPQPWSQDDQQMILKSNLVKRQFQQIKSKKIQRFSASHHTSLSRNTKRKLLSSHLKSASSIYSAQYIQNEDSKFLKNQYKRNQNSITIYNQDLYSKAQYFNYSNEQKARVSLEHMVHQKKQQKISRILKMKTHFIDKTAFKQQKMQHHSKFLIEALEKLSSDNILKKSIDRAVDVLKKRTTYSLGKAKRENIKTYQQQQNKVHWISCHKIEKNDNYNNAQWNKPLPLHKSLIHIHPQISIIKSQKSKKLISHNQKNLQIQFKPKRNWIVQNCKGKNPGQIINIKNNPTNKFSNVQNLNQNKKAKSFLQINQLLL